MCNKESKYTWWKGRTLEQFIYKRLDRVFCSKKMHEIFPLMEVEHLVRSRSYHTPLMLQFSNVNEQIIKLFRFLNFWLKKDSYMKVIRQNLIIKVSSNPFIMFRLKLKLIKSALTLWSRENFRNIFQEILNLEEIIKVSEKKFEKDLSEANIKVLLKSQVELRLQL